MLASAQWRTVSWRSGTKGRLKARFAAVRVRTADGPPQRIWDKGQQHLPGDEAWLIGEHRASGEKKYYLANLAAGMDLRSCAASTFCIVLDRQCNPAVRLRDDIVSSWALVLRLAAGHSHPAHFCLSAIEMRLLAPG